MRRDRLNMEVLLGLLAAMLIIIIIAASSSPEPEASPQFNSPDIVEVDVFKPP